MKKINYFLIISLFATLFLTSCRKEKLEWKLDSPDGSIILTAGMGTADSVTKSQLYYRVEMMRDGETLSLIGSSPLGIIRKDADFFEDLRFVLYNEARNHEVEYKLLSGKQRECSNVYNEMNLQFQNREKKDVNLTFRVYNNGVAFSYFFPGKEGDTITVASEKTGFYLPDAKTWMHAYDTVTTYAPAYETYFQGPLASGTAAPRGKNGWAFPALFETASKQYVLICESGFNGSYGASHLDVSPEGLYTLRNPEVSEGEGYYPNTSTAGIPLRTPWRIIMAGNTLDKIVGSNLVTDLADECKLKDTDWIQPGRASWSWWYDHDSPQDFTKMIPFIDFTGKMGWEYFLVDANWNIMKNGTMEELAAYSAQKKVGLLLWYNSGGKHNVVTEQPRDLMDNREARRNEFQRIHQLGIKGIKVDFFQSDKQEIIKQYIDILEDAADFQILVNFHGCTLPKGWSRTYPNLVSSEAIRGAECYSFDPEYPALAPAHLAIIPFTRGVIGPADYTPGSFSNQQYPRLTTDGFELALPVIIESGITHFADAPWEYARMPEFVIDFLHKIPVVWDEVRLLDGYPGKYAVMARRHHDLWYIAGINAQKDDQVVRINLHNMTGQKSINLMTDTDEKGTLIQQEYTLRNDTLELRMYPSGGFAGSFKAIQ